MANNTTISNAAAIAACNAVVDLIDVGAGTAVLKIYDGAQPTNPDVAVGAQVLLAELNLSNPAFGAAVDANPGGRATANAVTADAAANTNGTAAWFRVFDRDGTAVLDGSVGTVGADLNLNTVAIVAGANVSISSWTFTWPET